MSKILGETLEKKSGHTSQCWHTNALIFSDHCLKWSHCIFPQVGQGLCEVFAKVPSNSCYWELCTASLNEKWFLALKIYAQKKLSVLEILKNSKVYKSRWVDLIIVRAQSTPRRELCGGTLRSFGSWTPLACDGKGCPLVPVKSDDPPGFVDHVMHAIFFEPSTWSCQK